MTIADRVTQMMAESAECKDYLTFLSMHAKGNILNLGLCEKACGVTALLYGVERSGGHVWSINPFCADCIKMEPYSGHPQWTLIESDPLNITYARASNLPEEIDLLYITPDVPDGLGTALQLKAWGPTVKTVGLIIVSRVKADTGVREACEEFAKSYGMKFRVRESAADLGVIFYPDNKEALQNE